MKIHLTILLLALAFVGLTAEETTKTKTSAATKHYIQLTDQSFENFFNEHKLAFVCIYDRMAEETKQILKQFEATADKQHEKIAFARLDITKNPKTVQKYQFDRFPSFIFFDEGDQIQYDLQPTSQYMIFWLDRILSPAYSFINDQKHLDTQLAEEDVAKVFFYGQASGKQFDIYARVGHLDRDNKYFVIENPDLIKDMWTPTVKLHASFHHPDSWSTYEGEWTKEDLSSWVDDRSLPTIVTLNHRTTKYIFDSKQTTLFLVDAGDEIENLLGVLEKFCEENDKFTCGKVSKQDEFFYSFASFIGPPNEISKSELLILDSANMRMFRYKNSVSQLTKQSLEAWIADWKAGKLQPDNLDDEGAEGQETEESPSQASQCEADKENTKQYAKTMEL